jgi:hypothetical protein
MRTLTWIVVFASAVACSAGDEPSAPRFALSTDVVRDARSGLVWAARDSGGELSWRDADRYCRELALDSGGGAWRLPLIEELAALYDTSVEQPCGEAAICRIDPAIHLSSPYQWSATAPQPDRRVYYDFALGSQFAPLIRPALTRRALCTRGERDDHP